ncbi:MAG: hypothetical protein CMM77_06295 [Rhodospirillaceae bacterium]|nr:hypothetical protein [Magnetovibrio sp.]MAY66721.1 hypothetical protein [Rhodospirillaceae bacterium]|tara:strand:+ start:834 stop:1223 length:390 start_codon:yes stop_codon:yes gene_type:complete
MPIRLRIVSTLAIAAACLLSTSGGTMADQPRVVHAEASPNGDGSYTVSATVRHGDTGWDHYADNFEVLAPDGTMLARRVLYHPHVDEQPFTRSVGDVVVPPGIKRVIVRAHDKVHGYGKGTVTLTLPDR